MALTSLSSPCLSLVFAAMLAVVSAEEGAPPVVPPPLGTPSVAFMPLEVAPPLVVEGMGTYGGTLLWSELGEVETFHPFTPNGGAAAQELRSLLFSGLVAYDNATWEHTPRLAHSWETSEDYKTWTFHLRRGIKWSDGDDFDAKDVLFTFRAAFHPKSRTSIKDGFKVGNEALPEVSSPDPYTVIFKLSSIDALFLAHIGAVSIAPEHKWGHTVTADDTTFESLMTPGSKLGDIVGTGPFKLVEYATAERVIYERNPYYAAVDSRGQRLPYVDRVIVLLNKDVNTQEEQFLGGTFDLLNSVQPPSYKSFEEREKSTGAFEIFRLGVGLNTNFIVFNQHPGKDDKGQPYVAPHMLAVFQDKRFRQAMSHAIDRENMCKVLMDRRAEPIYGSVTRANKIWHNPDEPRLEYDPDKANKLLDEMGLGTRDSDGTRKNAKGQRIELTINTNVENNLRVSIMSMIKEDLVKVGIGVTTRPIVFNELTRNMQDGHKWEAIILGWGSGVPPDPLNGKNILRSDGRLHCWYPEQPEPATEWEAKIDELIAKMDLLPNDADRLPLWHEITRLQGEWQPITYLFAAKVYACAKPRVRNLKPSLLRPSLWWNAEQLYLENGGK